MPTRRSGHAEGKSETVPVAMQRRPGTPPARCQVIVEDAMHHLDNAIACLGVIQDVMLLI